MISKLISSFLPHNMQDIIYDFFKYTSKCKISIRFSDTHVQRCRHVVNSRYTSGTYLPTYISKYDTGT